MESCRISKLPVADSVEALVEVELESEEPEVGQEVVSTEPVAREALQNRQLSEWLIRQQVAERASELSVRADLDAGHKVSVPQ